MHYINRLLILLFFVVVPYGHGIDFCENESLVYSDELNTSFDTYEHNGTVVKQNDNIVDENFYHLEVEEAGYVEISITSPSGLVFFSMQEASCYDTADGVAMNETNTSISFYTDIDPDFNIVVFPNDPAGANNTPYTYTITVTYTTVRDSYIAADICYSDPITSPLCFGDCNTTIPILNISDINLTDVEVVQKNEVLLITNANILECGINNINLNCDINSTYVIGLIENVDEGPIWDIGVLEYNATDPNATIVNVYEVLNTSISADVWPSREIMYTTYMKYDAEQGVDVMYTGEMQYCIGGSPTNPGGLSAPLHVDVVEHKGSYSTTEFIASYNDTTLQVIETKISDDDTVVLNIVHLDGNGVAEEYDSAASTLGVMVFPLLENSDCTSNENLYRPDGVTPAFSSIFPGDVNASILVRMPADARKDNRISANFMDLGALYAETGDECLKDMLNEDGTLNTGVGNLAGFPQCVNSEDHYISAYGEDPYNRCFGDNGEPCLSSNSGYSCGPGDTTCPGYNPIYDNELGCLMCTLNVIPDCSSDNFAIRPNEFHSTLDPAVTINASEPTTMTFSAFTFDGATPTELYNEVQLTSFDVSLAITDPLAVCPFSIFQLTPNVEFTDGAVTGDYTFDHVGLVTMKISETAGSEYALVDAEDTLDADRYITPWEAEITIIPDHFKLELKDYYDANFDINTDKNFTYLSDDYKMMSKLEFNITAEDFLNNTTLNYTDLCAAKDVDVTVTHSVVPPPLSNFVMRLQAKYVTALPVDNITIPVADDITFTTLNGKELPKEFFLNGTASLELLLNFDRKTNLPLNPFKFTINDITVVDENATTTVVSPEIINKDATFFYARVHSPRSRAMCNGVTCNGTVNFYYEVYGKNTTTVEQGLITTLLGAVPKKSLDSVNWYRNTEHNLSSDGNVTGSTQNIPIFAGTPVSFTPNIVTATTVGNYNYDGSNGYPFKGTVTVDSSEAVTADTNQTQSWLIYDQFNPHPATIKNVELEYYGPGSWSSDTGPAGSVTDESGNKNRNTNRRIRW